MPWIILFIVLCLIFAAVLLTVVIRTMRFKPSDKDSAAGYAESMDSAGTEKLAEAIRVPTISCIENDKMDWTAFRDFQKLLENQFPLVHQQCEKTIISDYSLIYHLKSGHSEPKGKPVLITAHMDVVPVEEGTQAAWTQPPFSGKIEDGILWGRGTLDTKIHLIGALEALERLLAKGFLPARDIYMAFGHDEELNGQNGARCIAEHLENLGLEFDFVLDEGGCVVKNVIDGVDKPIALVGVGEKGYANILFSVTKDGGHSSMPEPHSSLGILAKAICRIEDHPFKPRLTAPTRAFLMRIGPHMKRLNRVIIANLWLFKPIFIHVFSNTKSGSALLRTTIAVTMAQGSPAPNVIPQKSSAVVNSRILPGEDKEMLMKHFRSVLKGLPVEMEPIHLDNPSKLSSSDSNAFHYIEELIREFCPGAIIAPYLVMASTDAKKYEGVSENIFRFTPYVIDNQDLAKIHGTNENISVVNVNRCIDFFKALMERL